MAHQNLRVGGDQADRRKSAQNFHRRVLAHRRHDRRRPRVAIACDRDRHPVRAQQVDRRQPRLAQEIERARQQHGDRVAIKLDDVAKALGKQHGLPAALGDHFARELQGAHDRLHDGVVRVREGLGGAAPAIVGVDDGEHDAAEEDAQSADGSALAEVSTRPENADTTLTATISERIAGRVLTPGIDDVLEALESEEEVVRENQRLLEGVAQTREQLERWTVLLTETRDECNKRLKSHGVFLAAAAPNPNGLGACFFGMDQDVREYTVMLNFPATERDDFGRASKEAFVRWAIDAICSEVVAQRSEYLRRMGRS